MLPGKRVSWIDPRIMSCGVLKNAKHEILREVFRESKGLPEYCFHLQVNSRHAHVCGVNEFFPAWKNYSIFVYYFTEIQLTLGLVECVNIKRK